MTEKRLQEIEPSGLEELDASIGTVLRRTLPRLFGISEKEAEDVVADAFFSYVHSGYVAGPAKWIVAAACVGALVKQHARVPALDPPSDPRAAEAEVLRKVIYARGLQRLPAREREAVALRNTEKKTYWAIGAAMGITPALAKTLVARAMAKLRRWAREEE